VAKQYKHLDNQVYSVPRENDEEVGRLKLISMGIEIDTLTAEQEHYSNSWNVGT
jgi:adenosylhomocysteinase